MKYALIRDNDPELPVQTKCRLLTVSRTGYYDWLKGRESPVLQRQMELDAAVLHFHQLHQNRAGIRKIRLDLLEFLGMRKSYDQVRKSFLRQNLFTCGTSRRKPVGSSMAPSADAPENILDRDFVAVAPNKKWVADTTYIPTNNGFVYLAVIMDLFSRMIVGHATSRKNDASLVCAAMRNAIAARRPSTGLILHTDQGATYNALEHRKILAETGITHSLSRRGECLDNAAIESWNARFKVEAVHNRRLTSPIGAEVAAINYIHRYYNCFRRHSKLNYVSPIEYERRATMKLAV